MIDESSLGMIYYFHGIEVVQSPDGNFVSQKKYVQEVLCRFRIKNYNCMSTPTELGLKLTEDLDGRKFDSLFYKQIVRRLMYLTCNTSFIEPIYKAILTII